MENGVKEVGLVLLAQKAIEVDTWSIMGMSPMALARRKQPGRTGSCVNHCNSFSKLTMLSAYV